MDALWPGMDLAEVRDWVAEAGRLAMRLQAGIESSTKADNTLVTAADRAVEACLRGWIAQRRPHDTILGEEEAPRAGGSAVRWVIDPIDGTRAYATGLPGWSVSVGILVDDVPLAGVVHLPAVGGMYWAGEQGAFCNGRRLPRLPETADPSAFLAVPSDAHRLYDIDLPRLRSFGSTAVHLMYVATGAAAGALTRRVRLWDLAAALPILRHTGVQLSYLSGAPVELSELLDGRRAPEPIVAAQQAVLESLRARIRFRQAGGRG